MQRVSHTKLSVTDYPLSVTTCLLRPALIQQQPSANEPLIQLSIVPSAAKAAIISATLTARPNSCRKAEYEY
jgi:hypothetical protein